MCMRKSIARLRGAGFILWHARHMIYHIAFGLLWAWFLRQRWHELNPTWIWMAVVGSILPDIDHIVYYFGYGKNDAYNNQIKEFLKSHQWRNLTIFIEQGHKQNTNLSFHNIYITFVFIAGSLLASFGDWQAGVVLFGAICSHYLFDMFDDIVQKGSLNQNWKRWGNGRV